MIRMLLTIIFFSTYLHAMEDPRQTQLSGKNALKCVIETERALEAQSSAAQIHVKNDFHAELSNSKGVPVFPLYTNTRIDLKEKMRRLAFLLNPSTIDTKKELTNLKSQFNSLKMSNETQSISESNLTALFTLQELDKKSNNVDSHTMCPSCPQLIIKGGISQCILWLYYHNSILHNCENLQIPINQVCKKLPFELLEEYPIQNNVGNNTCCKK